MTVVFSPAPKPISKPKAPKGLRKKSPARKTQLRSGKPLRKLNVAKQAKRRVRQAAKHRAYMRSDTRKFVDFRSGGKCEAALQIENGELITIGAPDFLSVGTREALFCIVPRGENWTLCENKSRTHHHLTYARFGGNELPEDMLKVCDRCNAYLESQHPTRKRNY